MYEREVTLLKKYLKEEYAGYEDKKEIIDNLQLDNIQDFYLDVTAQLNRLEDLHLGIIDKNNKLNPVIQVKNSENKLFVTRSIEENLPAGTEIIKLGEFTVPEIIRREKLLLFDPNPERYMWNNILRKYPNITTKNNKILNILKEIDRSVFYDKKHEISDRQSYCYIYFPDFLDELAIHRLIKDNDALLSKSRKFIIDVRSNRGGSDFAYMPLLPYLFPPNFKIVEEEVTHYFNYTKLFCDARIASMKEIIEKITDESTRENYRKYVQSLEENYGNGMTSIGEGDSFNKIDGVAQDIEVIVILNELCGSSGDNFVMLLKESPFVTVIGRATLGMNDYANCFYPPLSNQYDLICGYSRDGNIDIGKGMAMKGIEPDIHIPWTTDEIYNDVLLKKAEELLDVN